MATINLNAEPEYKTMFYLRVESGDYIRAANSTTVWLIVSSELAVNLENGMSADYGCFSGMYRKLSPGETFTVTV